MIGFNALAWIALLIGAHAGHEPPGLLIAGFGVACAGLAAHELVGTALSGQTVGKRLVGIRVVRSDTYDIPGWTRAAVRTFGLVPLGWMPHGGSVVLGSQAYAFTQTRQGLHDLVAGTMVVDDQEWRRWASHSATKSREGPVGRRTT